MLSRAHGDLPASQIAPNAVIGAPNFEKRLSPDGVLKVLDTGCTDKGAKNPFKQAKTWTREARKGIPRRTPSSTRRALEVERLEQRSFTSKNVVDAPAKPKAALENAPVEADLSPAPAVEEVDLGPPTTAGLMFPGQGSQYVGMLKELKDDPVVSAYAATAQRVLGYDLLEICLQGPEHNLEETNVCQPAMFMAGMAGIEKLRQTRPDVVERPGCVSGLSLGEYTALCIAGVFTFEEGMELVKVRGEAMAEAAKAKPQAMLSVAGLDQATLEKCCKECAKGGEVAQIANVLFPKGFACAGTKKGIDDLQKSVEKAGAMQAKLLKTSGGFHTDLMKPAQKKLQVALDKLLPKMKPPTCDVYMNVTAKKLRKGTPPSEIVPLLAKQLCSPVLWEPLVKVMIKDGLTEFFEVGPMKQLKAMMKRIDANMWKTTTNVDV